MDTILKLLQKHAIPLPLRPVQVMLDTDIGPDVDDVGALALLNVLANAGICEIISVTHCTSSTYGAPCIDVINRAYGHDEIPIGTLWEKGFLDKSEYQIYNKYLFDNYEHRFIDNKKTDEATSLIIDQLRIQPDNSITMVAIGPLVNLSNCLSFKGPNKNNREILNLIKKKVRLTVIMGGAYDGLEWNFEMAPKAAKHVCENWPTPIMFATSEIGNKIITGREWDKIPDHHPVKKAYQLHSPNGRPSWDLVAVWTAVFGAEPLFEASQGGCMKIIDSLGRSIFKQDDQCSHIYLRESWNHERVSELIDDVINSGENEVY